MHGKKQHNTKLPIANCCFTDKINTKKRKKRHKASGEGKKGAIRTKKKKKKERQLVITVAFAPTPLTQRTQTKQKLPLDVIISGAHAPLALHLLVELYFTLPHDLPFISFLLASPSRRPFLFIDIISRRTD